MRHVSPLSLPVGFFILKITITENGPVGRCNEEYVLAGSRNTSSTAKFI